MGGVWADMPAQFVENLGTSYVLGSIHWRARVSLPALRWRRCVCFSGALLHWHSGDPVKFACYLLAALLASSLKVTLPASTELCRSTSCSRCWEFWTGLAGDAADRAGLRVGQAYGTGAAGEDSASGLQLGATDGFKRDRQRLRKPSSRIPSSVNRKLTDRVPSMPGSVTFSDDASRAASK